jgi:PAS domain S-box-containing protein
MPTPLLMEAAWQAMLYGYLRNPLPTLLKEKILLVVGRGWTPAFVTLTCCRLQLAGAPAEGIARLLASKAPPLRELLGVLEHPATPRPSALPPAGTDAEAAFLFAIRRIARHRDPGGKLAAAIRSQFGDAVLNAVLLLITYAKGERVWQESSGTATEALAPELQRARRVLIAQCPEFERLWTTRPRRRPPSRRAADRAAHRRMRAAIAASEKRFRAVISHSPHPMMVYAEDGAIIMMNPAWTAASGWGGCEIRSLHDWFARAETGAERPEDLSLEVDALYESDEPIDEGEVRIRSRDSGERTWTITSAPLGTLADGRRAVLRMAVDVTQRRDMEAALWDSNQKMAHIIESISDGFLSLDSDGRFLFINREAERILGVTPSQLLNRRIGDGRLGPLADALLEQVLAAVEQQCDRTGESTEAGRVIDYRIYVSAPAVTVFIKDITEARRTQTALAEAQANLRLVASAVREVFWVQEAPSLRILYVAPSYETLWERSTATLMENPLSWFDSVHIADRQLVAESIKNTSAGMITDTQYRIVVTGGRIKWIRVRCLPVKDEQGVLTRIVGMAHDTTADREADASVRASQRIVRDVANSIHALVFTATPDASRILYLNRGVEQIWQYTHEEAYSACATSQWQKAIHPEDREAVLQAMRDAGASGKDATIFCRIVRKDGEHRRLRLRLSAVTETEGDVAYLVGIAEDITQQTEIHRVCRALKLRLDAILAASPLAMILMDREGRVEMWNPAAERLFGYPAEEVVGRFNPVVPTEEVSRLRALHEGISEGRRMRGLQVPAICKDGRRIELRLAISPVRNDEGAVESILAVVQENRSDVEEEPDSYAAAQ